MQTAQVPKFLLLQIVSEQERISKEMENVGEDMERMQQLLDTLDKLNSAALSMDVQLLDKRIDQVGTRPRAPVTQW